MPDSLYEQRYKQRQKWILRIGGGILGVIFVFFLVRAVFHDTCTNSFYRTPQSVIQSFVMSVSSQGVMQAMNCWSKNDYYSLDTGCSEICLQRMLGTPFQIANLTIGDVATNSAGRDQIKAEISGLCPDGKTTETGEIILDTANEKLPWTHWKIVQSSFGGSVGEPWCK